MWILEAQTTKSRSNYKKAARDISTMHLLLSFFRSVPFALHNLSKKILASCAGKISQVFFRIFATFHKILWKYTWYLLFQKVISHTIWSFHRSQDFFFFTCIKDTSDRTLLYYTRTHLSVEILSLVSIYARFWRQPTWHFTHLWKQLVI